MILFNSIELKRAIEVQKRCYNFLRLIKNDELSLTGQWAIGTFHENTTNEAERIKDLIVAHYLNLPKNSRPITTSERDLSEFSNFFVSYLFCSFDYIASEKRLIQESGSTDDSYCWCDLCTRLTDAPNLRLKKVSAWDKNIADLLEEEAVRGLFSKQSISISDEKLIEIINDSEISESKSLLAYGIELIRRCKGEEVDSSSLVLWRRFAWENNSPKKEFALEIEMFEKAELETLSRVK